ncbi:ribosomal protein S8 [Metarhizium robertsii]|uniref:Ribosomal protein S8 n=1 Tax=Metarhizium robertsii TaxID=568076 RepID=A0A0A1UWH7_9HYPO|nr:ribosomal protein S8 [Metarhizium robertsii]
MVRISVSSDALKSTNDAEKQGKRQVIVRPSSQVIVKSLELMQKKGHVSELVVANCRLIYHRFTLFYVSVNKCGVISPRCNVRLVDMEKWVVRLRPARQFGHAVLTTSLSLLHPACLFSSVLCRTANFARKRSFSLFRALLPW